MNKRYLVINFYQHRCGPVSNVLPSGPRFWVRVVLSGSGILLIRGGVRVSLLDFDDGENPF